MVPTVRQDPDTNRWIRTATSSVQAAVPSSTMTIPDARRLPESESVTLRRCLIVNGSSPNAVPFGFVTLMGPVVAPLGTMAVTCVAELMVNDAETPLNFTALTLE